MSDTQVLLSKIAAVRERMVNAGELKVPLKVDIGTGANWDEAH